MHRILILPDIRPAGYPATLKARYRYRISGGSRIPDIRPDIWSDIRLLRSIFLQKLKKIMFTLFSSTLFCFSKYATTWKHFFMFERIFLIIWPDIRLFLISGWPDIRPNIWQVISGIRPDTRHRKRLDIRPDIQQVISGIRPDTGYWKMAGYLAKYPASRISGASLYKYFLWKSFCKK